jgi:hypothetical protein
MKNIIKKKKEEEEEKIPISRWKILQGSCQSFNISIYIYIYIYIEGRKDGRDKWLFTNSRSVVKNR